MVFRHGKAPVLPDPAFVDLPSEDEISPRKSTEIKRATIVGNPMFSNNVSHERRTQEEVASLDDLNLGMDYDQIMQYFHNLKESNA